jgi:rhomboid protease GluP
MSWTGGALAGDWLVKAIITINLVYFTISVLLSIRGAGVSGFLSPSQGSLLLLGATGTYPIDYYGRYWTLISANYLHGGILHIVFNLMAFSQLAPKVSGEYGSSRMFSIYSIGGVIGYVVSYMAGVPFTIGASGAVCGLIGALLYYGKSRGGVYGGALYREVSGWVISLFMFGLIFPGINNWAHGGGILGGIIAGALIGYNERRRENNFDHALALLCGLVTISVLGWAVMRAYIYS